MSRLTDAASLDRVYRALADPSRRAMLRFLALRPGQSVSELAELLPIALPTVMKHLDVLETAGLVARKKTGRVVNVALQPRAMDVAMAWLEETETFWSRRLDRLAEIVARPAAAKEKKVKGT